MEKKTIGFIGGGRIAKIMLTGLKNAGFELDEVTVYDPKEENLDKIKEISRQIQTTGVTLEETASAQIVVIALHPPMVMEILESIKPYVKEDAMLVSLAPKITIEKIQAALPGIKTVMRANPNAPDIINKGTNPVVFSESCKKEDQNYLMELFAMLGSVRIVEESKIEAYAVICAMGSTYFWFQMQHLQNLAVEFGMDQEEARQVISEMIQGTLETLFFSDIPESEVMDLVPVKPIGESEDCIKQIYSQKITEIFNKIKP